MVQFLTTGEALKFVSLQIHAIAGLHENDFIMASKIDRAVCPRQ